MGRCEDLMVIATVEYEIRADTHQSWQRTGDTLQWSSSLEMFRLVSTLNPDPGNSCIWHTHSFESTSASAIGDLNSQTCLHLVNAPQFISIRGERIWACLDGQWTTTDEPVLRFVEPCLCKMMLGKWC